MSLSLCLYVIKYYVFMSLNIMSLCQNKFCFYVEKGHVYAP